MATTIYRIGSRYVVSDAQSRENLDTLPIGNYVVKQDIMGIFLERVDDFKIPDRIYGNVEKDVTRFLDTYNSRDRSTGVLLDGEKGCGKSLTAQLISVRGATRGIVTIMVNAPFHGDEFNELVQRITQPCIFLFDEFEKVYSEKNDEDAKGAQAGLLTLLDGTITTKKLFVFTTNNRYAVDDHMINRPGRIFYLLNYEGLDESFVRDYCTHNLKNKGNVESVVRLAGLFKEFNFDSLKAIVEEMNRYNETPGQALKYLNVRVSSGSHTYYDAVLKINGRKVPLEENSIYSSPMTLSVTVTTNPRGGGKRQTHTFEPLEITRIDGKRGVFYYTKGKMELVLKLPEVRQYNVERYVDV